MGGALLAGWLDSGLDPKAVIVIDPAPPADSVAMLAKAGIVPRADVPAVTARVIVVAVKPQIIAAVLPGLRPLVGPGTIVLSIAAGKTIASFEAALGEVARRPRHAQYAGAGRPRHHRRRRQPRVRPPTTGRWSRRCSKRSARPPGSTTRR